jgi:holin-like protein
VKYIKQVSIILVVCLLAEVMEYFIPLPVAASMYGLILMLIALITKIIPLKEVEDVANFLVGNIAIMFIPPTVGIIAAVDEIKAMLVPLVVISFVTTLLIMAMTGWVAQWNLRKTKKEDKS